MRLITLPEFEPDKTKTAGLPYKSVGDIHVNPEYVGMVRASQEDANMTEIFIGSRYGVVTVGMDHLKVKELLLEGQP